MRNRQGHGTGRTISRSGSTTPGKTGGVGISRTRAGPERFKKKSRRDLDLMKTRGVRTLRWWIFTDFVVLTALAGRRPEAPPAPACRAGWVANFMKTVRGGPPRGASRLYPVFSSLIWGAKASKEVVSDKAVRPEASSKNAVRAHRQGRRQKERGNFRLGTSSMSRNGLVRHEDGGDPNKELTNGPITPRRASRPTLPLWPKRCEGPSQGSPSAWASAGLKWCGWQFDFLFRALGLDFFRRALLRPG